MVSNIVHVIDGIYIGDYETALDNRTLRRMKIDVVVNCTTKNSKSNLDLTYEKIPIPEKPTQASMMYLFSSYINIIKQINDYVENDKKILIHCNNGIQTAPTIMVIYLIVNYSFDLRSAVMFVKDLSPGVFQTGVNYFKCLMEIEQKVNKMVLVE